ncbi:uracil-DNA glycosylase [Alphaproteobacteria bacterium]
MFRLDKVGFYCHFWGNVKKFYKCKANSMRDTFYISKAHRLLAILGVELAYGDQPVHRMHSYDSSSAVVSITGNSNIDCSKTSVTAQDPVLHCDSLENLRNIVQAFDGCALKEHATHTVFGDGNPKAKIMLIGEAPGFYEDKCGIPFCGPSGKLLDKILAAVNLDRTKVYITNTVFWRPPENRRPTKEELVICRPFVERHIFLIKPELIMLVGSTAVEALLQLNTPMNKLRGQYFDYKNPYLKEPIKATAIFHPSYLLRQPVKKKLMWFDILKIMKDFQYLVG